MKAVRRATPAEFEAVRPFLRNVAERRVQVARAVLVDGRPMRAVAAEAGYASANGVLACVDAVWSAIQKYREALAAAAAAGKVLPPGWEEVTLVAPSALIERFRSEIAAAAGPTTAKK